MIDAKKIALPAGPALGALAGLLMHTAIETPGKAAVVAGVTVWCAVWWIFEPIAIAATSVIPFAAFPLFGVLRHDEVAQAYGHSLVLLFLGGFILSLAMERSGSHRRMALLMVAAVGGQGGRRLVLAFMLATAALSMWISNTATTLMMLPIVMAIIDKAEDKDLAVPLLLGVAYGSSIGGLGTPIGSPPNLVFLNVYNQVAENPMGFSEWMRIGLVVAAIFIPLAWLWLTRNLKSQGALNLPKSGPWRSIEKRTLAVFALAALLWIFRTEPGGGWNGLLQGWMDFPAGKAELTGDSTVGLLAAVLLFVIPDGEGGRLMDWDAAVKLPWGILLLFGGGICIASAFSASGLSAQIGGYLSGLTALSALGMTAAVATVAIFLTEITSNTATANVLMPILAATATATGTNHKLLMMPAALCCTLAFMLPVATPPNAIVFSTNQISIRTMVKEGFVLNVIGIVVVTGVCFAFFR